MEGEPEGEGQQEGEPTQIEIIVEPSQLAGVWANFAQVNHSEHEFTLDFVRIDYSQQPPQRGIVVARVAVSPLFITQLIDALQRNWTKYAEKAMPKEVHGGDDEGGTNHHGEGA
jgi:Protein of unknown function (DUF3467)